MIELSAEMERRLERKAAESGLQVSDYARVVLEENLQTGPEAPAMPMWRQLMEIGDLMPAEERARFPSDSSENVDHYRTRVVQAPL
jgi:hypothetical protein